MNLSTDGLIIREQNIGENSRLVTVLTRCSGVIRAFVKNAGSIKSGKGAATRLLCYSRLNIFKGRESYIIDDAQSLEMFAPLRLDVVKMALAEYFCELSMHFFPEDMPCEEGLRLILNTLYVLSRSARPTPLVKASAELRLASICGYMPDLVCCSECKKYEDENMHFFPRSGILLCGGCLDTKKEYSLRTGLGVTAAMRHSIYAPLEKLFSFSLSEDGLGLFERAAEEYLLSLTERNFKTLDFYKVIK
ncbi:MAG: DNA repair protein RecO [Acutalibacteraceae bacterium]